MPRWDGTGPEGKGPLTGGGTGRCTEDGDHRPARKIFGRRGHRAMAPGAGGRRRGGRLFGAGRQGEDK